MYDRHRSMFEDGSSFYAMSEAAARMLRDPDIGRAYRVIDALDEFEKNQNQLLSSITQNVSATPSVKWVIASRKVLTIVNQLGRAEPDLQLHLDLTNNQEDMAIAVEYYIDSKVGTLQALSDDGEKREEVKITMREKAADTFLWVALVIQQLEKANKLDVLFVLKIIPFGLEGVYGKMIR